MAFNHNGDTKPAARKAAGKTAAKKKARPVSSGEEVPGKSAEKKRTTAGKKAAAKRAAGKSEGKRTRPQAASGRNASAGRSGEAAELDPMEAAKQTMKGSVPAIVEAMVKKAKQGSCSHAKALLEMAGAKHMFGEEAAAKESGEPWAKLVLERMEQAEQEGAQERG